MGTIVGCNSSDDLPPLVTTKGRVVYSDNTPVRGVKVVFTSQEGRGTYEGVVNENGEFTLTTLGGGQGAAAGKYRVGFEPLTDADHKSEAAVAQKRIPKKLQDAESTTFTAEVTGTADVLLKLPVR